MFRILFKSLVRAILEYCSSVWSPYINYGMVKLLGFTLDCHLTMNAHVSNIARTCYFELRRLASIRRFLTSTATATLVSTRFQNLCTQPSVSFTLKE